MTYSEKIKKIQTLLDCNTPRLEHYYRLMEEMEDIIYNYTDYVEHNVDKEIKRLPYADYHMCCCLLTLIFREDYYINGKFKERFESGQVCQILERMITTLNNQACSTTKNNI